ncbi:hypothetical protein ACHQM5_003385 [Ranunculus cassubicifolius]
MLKRASLISSRVTLFMSSLLSSSKQCEYLMTVNTGPTRGPNNVKLVTFVEAIGGDNINTSNLIKSWGDMGKGYTYFLPNTSDRFRFRGRCMPANFCNIGIKGKKTEFKPHWYIENITVATTGEGGINRFRTFTFRVQNEFASLPIDDGECP